MNDFQQLIRKSTVMSLRPGQVVTTKHGLKHTIKEKNYIVYQQMDTTNYKSGFTPYSRLQRWKELFGNESIVPTIQTRFQPPEIKSNQETLSYKPLEKMNQKEYNQWIQFAKLSAKEYTELLEQKKVNEMNWKSFLGLDQLPTWPIPKAPISYSIQKPRKVIGRILRQYDRNTLLVGVAGFVCQLELVDIPNGYPELLQYVRSGNKQVDREKEYLFHVVSAHHDRFGNPNIRLSLKPPGQHKQFNVSLQESSFLKGIHIQGRDSVQQKQDHGLNALIQSLQSFKKK